MNTDNKIKFQVLIVTMNQNDFSLLKKMNIQSSALIGNQSISDSLSVSNIVYNGHNVTMYTWNEKGVGLNRNNLIMRTEADIILFADDDVIYDDGYTNIVISAFEEHPEADAIFFDVVPIPDSINPDLNKSWHRIRWYNCLKYGAPRLAIRTKVLREKNIYYSLLFGGGSKYSSGEDSLFIAELIKKKVRMYGCPKKIGYVTFDSSSWYQGYTKKYFMDKGLFFWFLSPKFSKLLCLQYCIRKKSLFKEAYSAREAYKIMISGIQEYRKGCY